MKPLVVLMIMWLGIGGLSAQEVKVCVISETTPVAYAYLFINDTYYGSSDSLGVVDIRLSDIAAGDTISANMVGMERGVAIYDPDHYTSEGITISLIPVQLEEITITAKDRSKHTLMRHVKMRRTPHAFTKYHGDYSITAPNKKETEGSFTYIEHSEHYTDYYMLNYLETIHTSDTTGMLNTIRYTILTALYYSLISTRIDSKYPENMGMKIRYMGKDKECHVFSVIKPLLNSIDTGNGFQSIIYADEKSREITSAKTTLLFHNGDLMEFSEDYALYKENGIGSPFIYPVKIEGSISYWEGKRNFSLENITVGKRTNTQPVHKRER